MQSFVLVVHLLSALGVIGLVLLQHGKGADMGASFGGTGSTSLFGVSGASNFLSRATALCVAVFFYHQFEFGLSIQSQSAKCGQNSGSTGRSSPDTSPKIKAFVVKLVDTLS